MAFTKSTLKLTLIPWIIGIAWLIEGLDLTIINTAIPSMALSLHVHPLTLKLGITSYLLTLAIFVPISGYITDKYGTKPTFLTAILLFLFGSIICGFASHLSELVVGRVIQGIGGALMTPVGRLIIFKIFSRSKFTEAFSHAVLLGQVGPAFGPIAGGALTSFINWKWIFFINIPFGLLLFMLTLYYIPNHQVKERKSFEITSFLLFATSAVLVIFSLSTLTEQEPYLKSEISGLLLGIILFFIYIVYSKYCKNPILNLHLFKINTFFVAVVGGLVARLGISSVVFLLPLLLQLCFKISAFDSGLLLLPYAVAMMFAKSYVRKFLNRFGFKKTMMINASLAGILMIMMIFMPPYFSLIFIILTFILGFLTSAQFTYMNILVFVDIEEKNSSQATSLSSVIQQITNAASICLAAGILILVNHLTNTPISSFYSFKVTFVVLGIITILSTLIFKKLSATAGARVLNLADRK